MRFLILGLILMFFCHGKRHQKFKAKYQCGPNEPTPPWSGAASWHEEWHRHWAEKWSRQAERRARHVEREAQRHLRRLDRYARKYGFSIIPPAAEGAPAPEREKEPQGEDAVLARARRRATAEFGFYVHAVTYVSVIAFLALVNLFTTWYPWFLWPALGWGMGLFSHYMGVFGQRVLRERFFDPAVAREVRREKAAMQTEKQASIDELSSTIAHEIRNPIAAAKSLVQQMGEDPTSVENVDYAKVALDELDRVERSVAHLLKYAKEEDYSFAHVNVASIVDAALTEMRGKLEGARVGVVRNYITGPTILADREKLRQVFANVLDNAIDALGGVAEGRRIELFIENGGQRTTVRVRDNGCGIAADRIDRIFNPFFTTKEKGTGLGMAISKKIVEAHEGSIDVVSEVGRGTDLAITLPLPQ